MRKFWIRLQAGYRAFKHPSRNIAYYPPPPFTPLDFVELEKVNPFNEHGRFRVIHWSEKEQKHFYFYPLYQGQDSGGEARRIFEANKPENPGDYASFYDYDTERSRKTYGDKP